MFSIPALPVSNACKLAFMERKSARTIADAIGNTPLVRLDRLARNWNFNLWAKLEAYNPGGSAKDRTAHAMVTASQLKPGATVADSSSAILVMALPGEAVLGAWTFNFAAIPRGNAPTSRH